MTKKIILLALCSLLLAPCSAVETQQPAKIPRIGYLALASLSNISARIEKFRQGLRELGYVEGKNIIIEHRYAEEKFDRLPALAAELVRLKVDIIVTPGAPATRAAKEATSTIPIVMTNDGDPIGTGFVASLARPGGNITGLSTPCPGTQRKTTGAFEGDRSQALPRGRLRDFDPAGQRSALKEIELAAGALKVKLQYLDVLGPKDIETAFRAASKGRAEAVLMMVAGPLISSQRPQVFDLAIKSRLPVIYSRRADVKAGGLMTYGVNDTDLDRRAARYVDKILKGAKPGDLPVEQPTKFEFIINL